MCLERRKKLSNTSITSKEAILATCRKLVSDQGLDSLNMRIVAKECEVALGALYYYFPSKNDLLIETVESVWDDIFKIKDIDASKLPFSEYLELFFNHISEGMKKYPNFFTIHSLSLSSASKNKAHDSMNRYLSQFKKSMLSSLKADQMIRANVFTEKFTQEDLVDFVLVNIICLLVQGKHRYQTLLNVIRLTIYE